MEQGQLLSRSQQLEAEELERKRRGTDDMKISDNVERIEVCFIVIISINKLYDSI
jgi:hypothetical protein